MKPPQVNEVKPEQEPELGYKVVFWASKFQRSLARRLVTQLSRCRTLLCSNFLQLSQSWNFRIFFVIAFNPGHKCIAYESLPKSMFWWKQVTV